MNETNVEFCAQVGWDSALHYAPKSFWNHLLQILTTISNSYVNAGSIIST